MELTGRLPVTFVGAAGALAAGIVGGAVDAQGASGVAWAALAGLGLSLMLKLFGLRIIGALVALLAVLGGVLSVMGTWWLVLLFLPVAASGVVMAWRGPVWVVRRRERGAPTEDWWKRLDQGEDPTES